MKRLIVFALLLNAALLAGRLARDMITHAQGGVATRNGDVNGDGRRDISDASYLLSWLFLGGDAPVAFADSPEMQARVAELERAVAALRESQPTGGEVAAAAGSLAVFLGDADIASRVPIGALRPTEGGQLALLLDGAAFGEVVGVHVVEEVSRLPVAHAAVRSAAAGVDPMSLLGTPARLELTGQTPMTFFAGEVVAAGLAGSEGGTAVYRLSIGSRMHRLARLRRSRAFGPDVTSGEIVAQVLGDHGIASSGLPLTGFRHDTVLQHNQTDWEFITRLLEEEGIYFFIEHGTDGERVRFASDSSAAPVVAGVFPYHGHQAPPAVRGEAYLHTFHAPTHPVPAGVQVQGWDYLRKAAVQRSHATGAGEGTDAVFVGERRLEQVDLDARNRRDRVLAAARTVTGSSTIPFARPGHAVVLDGLGDPFNGRYFITAVTHTVVAANIGGRAGTLHYGNLIRAIPAEVRFRPEGPAPPPRVEGMQTAVVTDNNDPDSLGRVKVKFPWLQDESSGWIRIQQTGAGRERGTFWLPEVDDEVLVSFLQGDPRYPVVVGSLWNGRDRPPEAPSARNDRRTFKSRSGHKLVFDDTQDSESMTLEAVRALSLDAAETRVSGLLASSKDAGPGAALHPGERHRDNSIVAWARISAAGLVRAPASLGVASARRLRVGHYSITLTGAARSPGELLPIAVAELPAQPLLPFQVRLVSISALDATTFEVFINGGDLAPADGDFVFMVTAR